MKELKLDPEQFNERIIFMSMFNAMFNDIAWGAQGNEEKCIRFLRGRWSFLGPGSEKKWYGTYSDEPDGAWDTTAEDLMLEFAETTRPMFRASSALEKGELRSKGGSKKTIHFNGSEQNVELILRTAMSANQLSLRSSSRYMHGGIQRYLGFRETRSTCSTRSFGNDGKFLPNFLLPTFEPMNSGSETCCKNTSF